MGYLGFAAGMAAAQSAADLEAQRQRAQQETLERETRRNTPDLRLHLPAASEEESFALPAEANCFAIDALRIEGERLESFAWLQAHLSRFAGQCIGREGINRIQHSAQRLLIDRGFVTTRLGIPEQNLTQGKLRFVLIPGVIRAIRFQDGSADRRIASAFPVRPGDLLNLRDIEQALEQMKRVPSQDVSIDIAPGSEAGESDLILTVTRTRPWRIGVALDDSGIAASGRLQASIVAAYDNPLGLNDLLSLSFSNDAMHDPGVRGTRGHTLQYSLPWGDWTLFLSDSVSHYLMTVSGSTQKFRVSGESKLQEYKLQRLLARDQSAKTSLQLRLFTRASKSYLEDLEMLDQRRQTTAAELGVIHRQYFGAAQLDLTAAYRQGVPWLGGQSDAPGHLDGTATFAYRMQTIDASLIAPFSAAGQSIRWISALRAQNTPDSLYATDFIAIGNRYTVRGFSGNATLAAERGGYWRNEIEVAVPAFACFPYIAMDYGRVSGHSATALPGKALAGGVIGLRGNAANASYDVFAGGPLYKPAGFPGGGAVAGFTLSYPF